MIISSYTAGAEILSRGDRPLASSESPETGHASQGQEELARHSNPAESSRGRNLRKPRPGDGVRHTRISGVWCAIAVAVILGVALIDFIVQNTRSMRIEFFGTQGHIPVAVALLAAALAGAVVVLAVGVCRTTQLRLVLRRRKNRAESVGTE